MPDGWCWCHLDELFLFIRNGKSIKQVKGAGGFPITRIETISNSVIDRERMGYANITDTKGLEEYILRNGDILMSHINSPIHVGKSALCCDISEDEIILHGMNLLCLRPHSGIDSFYLDMYFNSPMFRDWIRPHIKNAVNQASINTQNIGNTYIPVPPLAEQIRISNMYKSVNTYLTDLTLSLEGLTSYISSAKSKILDLAIHGKLVPQDPTDEPASELLKRINPKAVASCDNPQYQKPYDIPEGWTWCKLLDICSFLSRGKSPVYSETDRTYPVFAQKCNLKEGGISLEKAQFLDPTTLKRWPEEYKLKTGDIIVNSTGTGTVGRTRLFDSSYLGDYPFVVPDSHVSVIRTYDDIDSGFIFSIMSSPWIQSYLEDNLAGSTNQKELYISVLQNIDIPLPPINEQSKIALKVSELFKGLEKIQTELEA